MMRTWPLLMGYSCRRSFLRCSKLLKNLHCRSSSVSETESVDQNSINTLKNAVKIYSTIYPRQAPCFREEKTLDKQNLAFCNTKPASDEVEKASCSKAVSAIDRDVPGPSSIVTNVKHSVEVFKSAVFLHQNGTLASLHEMIDLIDNVKKTSDFVPPRIIYLTMDLALRLNQLDIANSLSETMPKKVHVLATSLRIRLFAAQKRFVDGLKEIENVLNEDTAGLTVECKVANIALDQLHHAIASADNSIVEMRRFRYLQRVVTKYRRRTDANFTSLLYSPVYTLDEIPEEPIRNTIKVDEKITEKILELSPYLLTIDD